MTKEKNCSFHKKIRCFQTKEIEEIIPCKHCGELPILIREIFDGEIASSFACSCQENHKTFSIKNFECAIALWNGKNKLPFPTARELSMLNYVGIAMNPKTFLRLSRWKKNNVNCAGSYTCVSETENGLSVFLNREIPDDTIKLLNKSDMRNILSSNSLAVPTTEE